MTKINTETKYEVVVSRIEELLQMISNEDVIPEKIGSELDLLNDLVAEYEKEHYALTPPTIAEILSYKMAEQNLNQSSIAKKIGVSPSRISEYMKGKAEPTLKIARIMCKELNISPALILGM